MRWVVELLRLAHATSPRLASPRAMRSRAPSLPPPSRSSKEHTPRVLRAWRVRAGRQKVLCGVDGPIGESAALSKTQGEW